MERAAARSHSAQRAQRPSLVGASYEQQASPGCWPFTPRERAALEKHLERLAAASSAVSSGTATPEANTQSRCLTPERQCESELLEDRTEQQMPAPKQIVVETNKATPKPEKDQSLSAQERARRYLERARLENSGEQGTKPVDQPASVGEVDEQWVRKAANPEERAERARVLSQAKFEHACADERARVCVFKRSPRPSSNAGKIDVPVAVGGLSKGGTKSRDLTKK